MGIGVVRDKPQAFKWRRKAAEQGDLEAELAMANAYETGDGVARDDVQAFYWNRKLADLALADAQRNVGAAYALGKGTPQDYVQAYVWLDIAQHSFAPGEAQTADVQALALESVASHSTASQIDRAKRQAERWISDRDNLQASRPPQGHSPTP
jgi:TPR repeat protein